MSGIPDAPVETSTANVAGGSGTAVSPTAVFPTAGHPRNVRGSVSWPRPVPARGLAQLDITLPLWSADAGGVVREKDRFAIEAGTRGRRSFLP